MTKCPDHLSVLISKADLFYRVCIHLTPLFRHYTYCIIWVALYAEIVPYIGIHTENMLGEKTKDFQLAGGVIQPVLKAHSKLRDQGKPVPRRF